jgi:hypothetical protein
MAQRIVRRVLHLVLFASWWLGMPGPAGAQPPTTTLVYPPWSHCYGLHRVNQTHLTLRAGFRYRFDDPQGLAAVKMDCENDTTTSRDDDELTVFGVNSGQHMLIYNSSLTAIAFYGHEGSATGEFRHPHGVAADRAGNVVVADTGNDRVHVLRYANDTLTHVRFISGSFAGRPLRSPLGIALEHGTIYVCDSEENRILVFDLEGNLQREIAPQLNGHAYFQSPFGIAVMRADEENNFFGGDYMAVTDSLLSRVTLLDQRGTPYAARRIRNVGSGAGEFYYAAIDYYGSVYCSDRGGRLHKFDRNLNYILAIGRPGRSDFEFDEPRGLGLYRRFGQLFVAEREGAQYLWMGTDIFTPSMAEVTAQPDGSWTAIARFFVTEYSIVSLDLVDATGAVRMQLQPGAWTAPGSIERPVQWRCSEPPAALRLRVQAVPTYSARKVLVVQKQSRPLEPRGRAATGTGAR